MLQPRSFAMGALLTALVAFGPISTDMYLPSLPSLGADFGAAVGTVQLTLSVFLAGFALSQLIVGPLSDRFGRRPVLLGGLALYTAASLACLAAPSIGALIAGRFVQALGACTGSVLGRAVVRDIHGPERAAKVLAYMGSAMALAPMLAPMAGGYLVAWSGWRSVFVVLALFGASLLALTAFRLGETNAHPDPAAIRPRRMLENYMALLGHREFLGFMLTIAFVFSGLFAFISGSSFVLIGVFGLEPQVFGLSFGMVVAGYATGSMLSGRLTTRFGIRRLVAVGSWVAAAAAGVLVVLAGLESDHVATVVGPMMVFMLGVGLILPNALAGAIGPFPRMAGAASALVGFFQMAFASLAGVAVGQFHDASALPMASVIAVMAVCALLTRLTLLR